METLKEAGAAAAKGIAGGEPGGLVSGPGSNDKDRVYDLNEEGGDDDTVVVVNRRVVVTETTVGMRHLGSGRNGPENIVQENVTRGVSAEKSEFNGNGISLVVDVHGSLDGGNENNAERTSGIRTSEGSYAENGGDLVEDLGKLHPRSSAALEDGDGGDKLASDKKRDFAVGDFVWGKIKSHPWWPGQIYDPSDASEFAAKFKHEDRLLVAYFGDGSCAWCFPSQLVPFADHFEEMSKHSTSRSFENAVKKALDEIGRYAESKMICSCVPEGNRAGLSRPYAVNAGVKPGVLVPEGDIGRLAIPEYEPAEVLGYVRHLGQVGSITDMLELVFLRSWLSAFYRVTKGCQLPTYHEPQEIEGLEDKNDDVVLDTDEISVPVEVPIRDLSEEDQPSSLKSGRGKGPMSSDENLNHSRKQKSVAELMREDTGVKPKSRRKSKYEEGTPSATVKKKKRAEKEAVVESISLQASTTGRKRGRKKTKEISLSPGAASNEGVQLEEKVYENAENGAVTENSSPQASTTARRRRRKNKTEISVTPATAVSRGIQPQEKVNEKAENGSAIENIYLLASTMGRKRSRKKKPEKSVSPGTAATEAVKQLKEKVKESDLSSKRKRNEDFGVDMEDDPKHESEKSPTSRERKKSKYLSPPYTTPSWRGGKPMTRGELDTESEKITKIARMGERTSKASSQLIVSPRIRKGNGETPEVKMAKGHSSGIEKPVGSPKIAKEKEKMILDSISVGASVNEVLAEVRSAGIDLTSLGNDSVELIKGFVTAFRSSLYSDGSNYKSYNKQKGSRKRKLPVSESGKAGNAVNLANTTSPQPPTHGEKVDRPRSRVTKLKKAARAAVTDKRVGEKKASPVSLIVSFTPNAPLPPKDEIIKIFSNYGSINEDETEVLLDTNSARVAFTSVADAEEAFKESTKRSPFVALSAEFGLRYASAAARALETGQKFSTSPKKRGPKPKDDEKSQVSPLKQKIEALRIMLESCNGKISEEEKSSLETQMRSLLQKASALAVKASS